MKEVVNKTVLMEGQPQTDYKELIDISIKQQVEGGFDYDTIDKILRVRKQMKHLSQANTFDLEDADFTFVKDKVNSIRWNIADEALLEFRNYINSLA